MKRIVFTQNRGVLGWLCSTLHATCNPGSLPRAPFRLLLGAVAAVALWAMPGTARGQTIYVANRDSGTVGVYDATTGATINASLDSGFAGMYAIAVDGGNLYVSDNSVGTIQEYNATTGATINTSLVSVRYPQGIAISGGNLFVPTYFGNVGEYDATTGATINASLVSGQSSLQGIAISGGNLFVTEGWGGIGVFDATTGATVNGSLVSGLNSPVGIAVSGGNLWVANNGAGTIGEYNATTGATINDSLVSGLSQPFGISVYGGNLFVTNQGTGTIGEYNAITGAEIDASLVSGLSNPVGIDVVPEPSTWAAGLLTAGALLFSIWRRRAGWLRLLLRNSDPMKTKTPSPRLSLHLLFAAAVMAVVVPITAHADILFPANNGFEVPNQNGGLDTYNPSGASWTFLGQTGIAENQNAGNPDAGFQVRNAPNGNSDGTTSTFGQAAFFQAGNGTLSSSYFSQSIAGFQDGIASVSFLLESRGGSRSNGSYPMNQLLVMFDSTLLGTFSTSSNDVFVPITTISIPVTAGSHTLYFIPNGDTHQNGFVDSVSISNVPEPSTWAAGLLTAGALLCSIWRKRAGWLRSRAHGC